MAKNVFNNLSRVLSYRTMNLDFWKRTVRCNVGCVKKCSFEAWTMTLECEKKISVLKMWRCCLLIRVLRKDYVKNGVALTRIVEEWKVHLEDVKNRKQKYTVHKI